MLYLLLPRNHFNIAAEKFIRVIDAVMNIKYVYKIVISRANVENKNDLLQLFSTAGPPDRLILLVPEKNLLINYIT